MKIEFDTGFVKDLKRLDRQMHRRVQRVLEHVAAAGHINDIANFKRLAGDAAAARIRVGDYRIGVYLRGDVVRFIRCLHRSEIYRSFP